MEIKEIGPSPYEKSIFPSLSFGTVVSRIKYDEAIIGVEGWLETDDGKTVARLDEILGEARSEDIAARYSRFDSGFKEEAYRTTLIALLDKKALDYIERRRMEDKKGDVKLTLALNVKTVKSKAAISHLHDVAPASQTPLTTLDGQKRVTLIGYAWDQDFNSQQLNRWVLSGNSGAVFLSVNTQPLNKAITIPSSDWIHDYAPKLGLGEYFIVEIPKGIETIREAWNYIRKAEECLRTWDTKGVYANCREAGTLLDRTVKERLKKDCFDCKERWGRAYEKFNDFASLDLHLEDIKKSLKYSLDKVKIGKADAEHILIVTQALVKYAEELLQ